MVSRRQMEMERLAMKRLNSSFAVVGMLLLAAGGPTSAIACGLPSEVFIQQTFLNIKYSRSMDVSSATWTLQLAGTLQKPDPERMLAIGERRAELDEAARVAALESVAILKDALEAESRQDHAISIVLIERMHEERLMPRQKLEYDPLASDPEDDLILITTEPVLHAITRGELTIQEGKAFGAVRLYGSDAQRADFASDFGQIGASSLIAESGPSSVISSDVDRAGVNN